MSTEIAKIITPDELALVENNFLGGNQIAFIMKATPARFIKQRPAKGGGTWQYVSGTYIRKVLNLMFGWDWDFEIISEHVYLEAKEVVVKGRLTCRSGGRTITKMQYGNKDIIFKKGTTEPLSIGNDLKAAATDALKKCAAEIGIASDVYHPDEFNAIQVQDVTREDLIERMNSAANVPESAKEHINRIINNSESESYNKAWIELKKYN
jgi:hypothetical protein